MKENRKGKKIQKNDIDFKIQTFQDYIDRLKDKKYKDKLDHYLENNENILENVKEAEENYEFENVFDDIIYPIKISKNSHKSNSFDNNNSKEFDNKHNNNFMENEIFNKILSKEDNILTSNNKEKSSKI